MAQPNGQSELASTLESGSQFLPNIVDDLLKKSIANPNNKDLTRSLRRLEHEYSRVKRRRIYHVPWQPEVDVSTNLGPRTEWMINLWTFSSSDPVHDSHGRSSKTTVSEWMSRFGESLAKSEPQSLQVVSLAEGVSHDNVKGFYSFWDYTKATCFGRLGELPCIPLSMCKFLISELWLLDLMPWSPGSAQGEPLGLSRPSPELPPSMRPSQPLSHLSTAPAPKRTWGMDDYRPGNLDPSRGNNEIYLTWQRQPTLFTSDLAAYIWEYHKSIPASESCKIVLLETPGKPVRLHFSFGSRRAQLLFAARLTNKRKSLDGAGTRTAASDVNWSPMNEAFLSICCALEIMTEDTANFLVSCSNEISRLSVLSRRNPSTSKMRFLLHLEDHRKASCDGAKHGLQVTHTISSWIKRYQLPSSEVRDRLDRLRTDLEYLDSELNALAITIDEDKGLLRQHFQLAQDLTLFRLTILAAIFLPLSFTTSFFGMNIDGLPEEVQAFFGRNPENPLPKDEAKPEFLRALDKITDENTRNATVALAAVLGSQDASWTTFAITAGCLLATLPLALMTGAVIRGIIVTAARYVIYWRGLAILGIFIVFFFSTFGLAISSAICRVNGSSGYNYSTLTEALHFSYMAFVALFVLFVCWHVYWAWIKIRQLWFWTVLLLMTGGCFLGDIVIFPNFPFPLMGIPWTVLGSWYMVSWWAERRREA